MVPIGWSGLGQASRFEGGARMSQGLSKFKDGL